MTNHQWISTVNEAVGLFRDALIAIIPTAEKALMHWREPDNYDDWDGMARALYHGFVVSSIEHAVEVKSAHPIPKYDVRIGDYSEKSFLSTSKNPKELAFICFETRSSPFDTVLFKRLDANGNGIGMQYEPLDDVYFVLSSRSANSIAVIDRISVDL